ncbi:hypothetical protein J3R30DRAFT_1022827 [Lentinula aciculospora]|uniref:Uncharacterized protein n=1 Tax=Lentinula aciculospora TaxID=153920 RepID=A0A9W9DJB1_9AGAR|nr:hypothetical protein J3R30DRAFT_1022827 [Lentinula aciculospora]
MSDDQIDPPSNQPNRRLVEQPRNIITYGETLGPQSHQKLHDISVSGKPRGRSQEYSKVLLDVPKPTVGIPRKGSNSLLATTGGSASLSDPPTQSLEFHDTTNTEAHIRDAKLSFSGVIPSVIPHNSTETPRYPSERKDYDLVGALSSAFAGNAIPDDFDDSSAFPSGSDSDSAELSKRRRRTRVARKPVSQIPTSPALKRLRQERTPKEFYAPPSEKTIQQYLDVEYSSVHLPPGVSVAPENDSEFREPDDELLLDYDSSTEMVEALRKQEQLKSNLAAKVLTHNLRFVVEQAKLAVRGCRRSDAFRQYNVANVPPTAEYVRRVEEDCGDRAVDWIWDKLPDWESNSKPRKYRSRVSAFESYSKTTTPSESSDFSEEVVAQTVKRPQPENDTNTRKRVKFSDEIVDIAPPAIQSEDISRSEIDAILCGKLLQKLIKGKVQITAQELQNVMSFLRNPLLEPTVKRLRKGEDLKLSTITRQGYDSILRSLLYIVQLECSNLGIPELIEGALKWEAHRIVNNGS